MRNVDSIVKIGNGKRYLEVIAEVMRLIMHLNCCNYECKFVNFERQGNIETHK